MTVPLASLLAGLVPASIAAQAAMAPTENAGNPAAMPSVDPPAFRPGDFNLSVLGGRGLLRARSPYTLPPGDVAVGGSALNFDRNPGDTDFFDFGVQIAVGLSGRTEVFLRVSPVLRTNSVGLDPVGFPIPPLDLFVDTYPTPAVRSGPQFLFAQEVPYKSYNVSAVVIDPPGHGAFSQSTGDITIGGKLNLLSEDRRDRFGLGISAFMVVPTETPKYSSAQWRQVTGVSGKPSAGVDLAASKRFTYSELLVNAGYTHVGDPDRGLRIQFVDSSQTAPDRFPIAPPQDVKLDLHDQLSFVTGGAVPAFAIMGQQVWLLGEFEYTRYIGHGVPVERLVHPAEIRTGLQVHFPWYRALALGMAFQLLLNDGGNGEMRTTFLRTADGRGDINFSDNVDPALASEVTSFLTGRGAAVAVNGSRVFSTNNAAFDGWRNISTAPQRVISQGGGNIVAFITWRVNARGASGSAR
jgi:hypothetical protein